MLSQLLDLLNSRTIFPYHCVQTYNIVATDEARDKSCRVCLHVSSYSALQTAS